MALNLESNKTNFVIVGGGTAGWLTALHVKQYYPLVNVTVIESTEIGILGAGEGSVPVLIDYLDGIRVPVSDLVKHANTTIKQGIKFTNWNGKNDMFFHGFKTNDHLSYLSNTRLDYSLLPLLTVEGIAEKKTFTGVDFTALNSLANNVNFIPNNKGPQPDPILKYHNLALFSIHFNATKFAEFLKSIGIKRGINVIDGVVDKINTDSDGYIKSLVLNAGKKVRCDFVFDCTGFKRLIIGNFYKSEWKDYSPFLPVNRALTFFTKLNENDPIPPYTEAIAMKYGWIWKIPVQDRFGCGYVFDSNLITDEDVKKEIDQLTGNKTETPRAFSFKAGSYKQQWIKNCMAVGLSTGFIEPLEATSIQTSIGALQHFLVYIKGVTEKSQHQRDMFNDVMNEINDDVLAFIHFHYHTSRADTIFWKDFAKNNKIPDIMQVMIDNNRDMGYLLTRGFVTNNTWQIGDWLEVGAGTGFFNSEEAQKSIKALNQGVRKLNYEVAKQLHLQRISLALTQTVSHRKFLDHLRTG